MFFCINWSLFLVSKKGWFPLSLESSCLSSLCSHQEEHGHSHNSILLVFLLQETHSELLAPQSFWLKMSQLGFVALSKDGTKEGGPRKSTAFGLHPLNWESWFQSWALVAGMFRDPLNLSSLLPPYTQHSLGHGSQSQGLLVDPWSTWKGYELNSPWSSVSLD